jgi:putative membrane protein
VRERGTASYEALQLLVCMLPLVAVLIGIAVGIITGITPGIHVNLVCSLLLASFPFLPFSTTAAVLFIISVAITHTFLDIIPSVYLGVPDSATALGVLPGHRYVLRGNGYMAVKLSTIGAFGGMVLGLLTYPLFVQATRWFDTIPKHTIGWILLAIPVVMWLRDTKKLAAGVIVVLASAYGFVGFSYADPLFPMLSGLFGAATLLYSLQENSTVPPQKALPYTDVRSRHLVQALLGGTLAGGLTAILPGVGAAHASVIGMLLATGTGDHGFLILTGTIGTTNFFLSLAAYDAVGKARNGALLAATVVEPHLPVHAAIGAALAAAGIGVLTTLWLGRVAANWMNRVPYRLLTLSVLCFVSALVVLLTGWQGCLLYCTGTAIGLLPATTKAARAHAMACIIVPVAWRFIIM